LDPNDRITVILIVYRFEDSYSHRPNLKLIMTSALMLHEGSHVPLNAACYRDVSFCVPTESCVASCIYFATSHCVTASEELNE